MRYAFLIRDDGKAAVSSGERSRRAAGLTAFQAEIQASGALVGGEQLEPAETAATVRCWDGGDIMIDGGPPGGRGSRSPASSSSTARTWTTRSGWRPGSRPPGTARSR